MEYDELLKGILEEIRGAGGDVREGCSEEGIQRSVEKTEELWNVTLPASYLRFLRLTNGMDWEDVVFCHAEDERLLAEQEVVAFNQKYRNLGLPQNYVLMGHDHEGLFCCNYLNETFFKIEFRTFQVLASYDSFTSMFHEAMEGAE